MANVCVVLGSVREGRMGLRVARCLVTSWWRSRLFGKAIMFLTVVAMYTLTIAMIAMTIAIMTVLVPTIMIIKIHYDDHITKMIIDHAYPHHNQDDHEAAGEGRRQTHLARPSWSRRSPPCTASPLHGQYFQNILSITWCRFLSLCGNHDNNKPQEADKIKIWSTSCTAEGSESGSSMDGGHPQDYPGKSGVGEPFMSFSFISQVILLLIICKCHLFDPHEKALMILRIAIWIFDNFAACESV